LLSDNESKPVETGDIFGVADGDELWRFTIRAHIADINAPDLAVPTYANETVGIDHGPAPQLQPDSY
jgi:hypothetical protein